MSSTCVGVLCSVFCVCVCVPCVFVGAEVLMFGICGGRRQIVGGDGGRHREKEKAGLGLGLDLGFGVNG